MKSFFGKGPVLGRGGV